MRMLSQDFRVFMLSSNSFSYLIVLNSAPHPLARLCEDASDGQADSGLPFS